MTKSKTTKRSLIVSALSLIICVAMLVGTTYAWFTDSVTSGNNIIKAGNLDIVMEYWDGTQWADAEGKTLQFLKANNDGSEVLWEPGCTYELPKIRIRNEGNLAAKVIIKLNGVVGDEKLLEAITLKTRVSNIPDSVLNGSYGSQLGKFNNATLDPMYGTPDGTVIFDWSLMGKGVVSPNSGHTDTSPEFTIFGHMKEEAGNEYQNLKIEGISITAFATQEVYEYDSFGREYDKKATFPAVVTDLIDGGESITVGDVNVAVPEGGNYTLSVDNKNVATDNAGNTNVAYDINLLKDGVKVPAEPGKLYDVSIFVGKYLVLTGVTHNGDAIAIYDYDAASGIVSFKTDSFSPFAVSYKANTFKVATATQLQNVISAIKDTNKDDDIPPVPTTIILGADIRVDSSTPFMYTSSNGAPFYFYRTDVTLDMNGYDVIVDSDALMAGKAHANAAFLIHYSNFKLVGEGDIITNNKSIPLYGWAHSTIEVYGGNFGGNASSRNESAVYVNNPNVFIDVYGGTYLDSKYAFNVHDNCNTTTVITLHEGVVFETFLKNGTVDVIASDINNGRIAIADDCKLETYTENGKTLNKVVKK